MQQIIQYTLFEQNLDIPIYGNGKYLIGDRLRFIDLFAGIGGMRIAWEKSGLFHSKK